MSHVMTGSCKNFHEGLLCVLAVTMIRVELMLNKSFEDKEENHSTSFGKKVSIFIQDKTPEIQSLKQYRVLDI